MEKDISWKRYFSDKRRYADIINGLGCNGEQLVKSTDLLEVNTQTRYGKTRDLLYRSTFGINFALIGIENQEELDYAFPLRNMSYDVAEYEKQASKIRKEVRKERRGLSVGEYLYGFRKSDKLNPVVTIVLYSGKERWDAPASLKEMLDFTGIPEHLQTMVSDYKVNMIELRCLENTAVFQTDVRQVFNFIKASENKVKLKELVEKDEYYQHMEEDAYEVVNMYMDSAEIAKAENYKRKDGKINMCTAIREMMEDSRKEGLEEGESLLALLFSHLLKDNRTDDAKLAAEDEVARKRFYREYGIINE